MRNWNHYFLIALLFSFSLSGCGHDDGLDRIVVEGQVNFDGAPVPFGSIWFEPAQSVGLKAPTGFAVIRDGIFKTEYQNSPITGDYVIRVSGYSKDISGINDESFDASGVKTLFVDYTAEKKIGASDKSWDLEVPN